MAGGKVSSAEEATSELSRGRRPTALIATGLATRSGAAGAPLTEERGRTMRFAARVLAGGLLAAGLVAVPAAAANAGTTYTVIWIDSYGSMTQTYSCSAGAQVQPGMNVDKITSGCADRIWLHQGYSEPGNVGTGNSYCVNPTAEAYAMSTTIDFQQVLPTANPLDCDSTVEIAPKWDSGADPPEYCFDGHTFTDVSYGATGETYYFIIKMTNLCNVRIWIHDVAGDALACVDPNGGTYTWNGVSDNAVQYQMSGNQAPCSAG
jgi:hypothetical protein